MAYFQLVSEWWIDAPVQRVWDVLTDYEALPAWWPSFARAERLSDDPAVVSYLVNGMLGLGLQFVQHTEVTHPLEELQFHADGDLVGTGIWSFLPKDGATRVVFTWNVDLSNRFLRVLSRVPGMRPLLAASHARVMAEGERCLRRELA